jgi:VanZ family protein
MIAPSEQRAITIPAPKPNEQKFRPNRFWRYAPVVLWMIVTFLASNDSLSASNTSRFVCPVLLWLYPNISDASMATVHFYVRKTAHFTEYAILALLAARLFLTSSRDALRQGWFVSSFCLIVIYALLDEYHQTFVSTRIGSIYDSLIDIAGGTTALVMLMFWLTHRTRL